VSKSYFDPACDFLLDLEYTNLFEPTRHGPGAPPETRCKGCGDVIEFPKDRKAHFDRHKRQLTAQRQRDAAAARARGAAQARKAKKAKAVAG
jgi:hypothetical protein